MSLVFKKLNEFADVISGYAFKSEWFGEGDSKVIRIGDLSNSKISIEDAVTIDGTKHKISENFKIKENDILMALSGATVGKIAVAEHKDVGAYINQRVAIIRAKDINTAQYLKFFFDGEFLEKLLINAGGAAQPNLSPKQLSVMEIPFPSLEKQRRIASILDKADDIRQKRQQAIAKLDELLQATFIDMFGDPVSNPKKWTVDKLGSHIVHANNGLSRRRKESENIGHIVLRLQDVQYSGIDFEKELNRIELDQSEQDRFRVDKGDILFIRVNGNPDYVGRSAVFESYKEPVFHNDHLIRIKVDEKYNPTFLSYCLNHKGGKKIISQQLKTSAGQHTISQSGLEVLEFYVPPIELQNKFEKLLNYAKSIPFEQNKLDTLFKALQQKAFNGTL